MVKSVRKGNQQNRDDESATHKRCERCDEEQRVEQEKKSTFIEKHRTEKKTVHEIRN